MGLEKQETPTEKLKVTGIVSQLGNSNRHPSPNNATCPLLEITGLKQNIERWWGFQKSKLRVAARAW